MARLVVGEGSGLPRDRAMKMLVGLALALALGGDAALAPLRATHPWGRWQPGAWVETETRAPGALPVVDRRQLVRAAADGYVLQVSPAKEVAAAEEPLTSWSFNGFAHLSPEGVAIGTEEVEVAGRSFTCTVWEARVGEGGAARHERSWVAQGIELPLRFQSSDGRTSVSLAAASLEDFVEVAGRKLACVRYEGSGKARDEVFFCRQWSSLDVPGGIVRLETLVKAAAPGGRVERQVVAFRGDRRLR